MTSREAIKKIEWYKRSYWRTDDPERNAVIDEAIWALEVADKVQAFMHLIQRMIDTLYTKDITGKVTKPETAKRNGEKIEMLREIKDVVLCTLDPSKKG